MSTKPNLQIKDLLKLIPDSKFDLTSELRTCSIKIYIAYIHVNRENYCTVIRSLGWFKLFVMTPCSLDFACYSSTTRSAARNVSLDVDRHRLHRMAVLALKALAEPKNYISGLLGSIAKHLPNPARYPKAKQRPNPGDDEKVE